MLTRIRQWLAPPIFEGDEDKTRVAYLLHTISLALVAMAVIVGASGVLLGAERPGSSTPGIDPLVPLGLMMSMFTLFVVVQLLMRRGRVQTGGLFLTSVFWLIATVVLAASGLGGQSPIFAAIYMLVVIMAGLLLGQQAAIGFAGLSILSALGFFYAELGGVYTVTEVERPHVLDLIVDSTFIGFAALLLFLARRGLDEALGRARSYSAELEAERESLEDVVKERTSRLANRARYLETTATIARDASAVLDLQALLSRVVTLISDQLGFYHAGIFLIDPSGEWAVLEAASSDGGRRMLARGHRLLVGEVGIVGYATGRNEPRVVLDVSQDAVFYDNPDLPDTRSEMALPLRARRKVIGALDVQSTELGAFSQADVAVLQVLADQVAVAIDNARLYQQVQDSLEAERRVYGELSREAWKELLRVQPDLSLVRDASGVSPARGERPQGVSTVLKKGEVVRGGDGGGNLALPIKVRGQVIGAIDAHKPGEAGEWTQDQVALLELLTAQLGDALDDARVYQEAQRRAVQERLLSDAAARMRETLDVDTVLRSATREMRDLLDLAEVEVRIGLSPAGGTAGQNTQAIKDGEREGVKP